MNEKKQNDRHSFQVVLLVLFDIIAVNISYYGALMLRFFVNFHFNLEGTEYPSLFWKIAPYYTVCCIIVFACFKLYSGIWKYAGLNDVNRILYANLVTCVIQIAGSIIILSNNNGVYITSATKLQHGHALM